MEIRRPQRQDTFDLRGQIHPDSPNHMVSATSPTADDSEHSVLEDDSDTEMDRDYIEDDELMEEDDDDGSSSLSIPNESIDFDLVYSLHSFAATVEGQANVVKGDSLYLMDDSNSYWWLVRVLKTQEVGYIPAENIETPFERLARLNKHRNIDLASATQAELQDGLQQSQDRLRQNLNNSRQGRTDSPSGSQSRLAKAKSVIFTAGLHVHRYPPAVWNEEEYEEEEGDEEDEWDIGEYEDEDPGLAAEQAVLERAAARAAASQSPQSVPQQQPVVMEPDDEMQWDDRVTEEIQAQQMAQRQQLQVQQQGPSPSPTRGVVPDQTRISPTSPSPIANTTPLSVSTAQNGQRRLVADPFSEFDSPNATDPSSPPGSSSTHETVRLTMTPTIARDSVFESQQAATYSTSADKKRRTEEEEAEEARKRARGALSPTGNAANTTPVKSGPAPTGGKLRKERDRSDSASGSIEDDASSNTSGKEKKKKTGVFGALFSRKKDKKDGGSKDLRDVANSSGKEKPVEADIVVGRVSDSSDVRSHRPSASSGGASVSSGTSDAGPMSPTTTMAMQQQQAMIVPSTPPQAHQHPAGLVPGGGASSFGSMNSALSSTPPSSLSSSPAAQTLRQRDQAQQALYQQYLNRSPASPPDLVPNYGLQSASVVNTGNRWTRDTSGSTAQSGLAPPASTPRQRPGSLILTPEALASNPIAASISQSPSFASSTGPSATSPSAAQTQAITELSVVRIFAGRGLEDDTEATFKTVLLNSQTGAAELVRQAVQRFRLNVPSGDEYSSDEEGVQMVDGLKEKLAGPSRHYYLTIKQIEGGASVKLRPDDKPLAVFEALVEDARIAREEREREERERELAARTGGIMATPKVKRSSVGSISSVASNLSMHPAIKRLPMNDFTDDSAVKFYLHRKGAEHEDNGDEDDGADGLGYRDEEDADETLIAADTSISSSVAEHDASISSPSTSTRLLVPPHATERLSSPSARFALQLVIHQEDLPDDMVFDTVTEAIIFKGTVRDREGKRHSHASSVSNTSVANSIPQNLRRKVFIFPKNVTVAEVIELGLERFGILEGVVDGGDEVEDKLTKRRSNASRVRYGLTAAIGDTEKELSPASRIIDAYPRPPVFRTEKRTKELHRRSMDSTQILGNMDDISLDDPVFILRRATSYRNSTSRHRMSAPLDELALRNLHQQIKRDSAASSARSGTDSTPISPSGSAHGQGVFAQQQDVKKQPSRKEIIAAQREALRATQRAILSTQTNSHRGVDVLLPGNARLRSSRYEADDRMRYSYVQPDGEIYDVSDIVEEELNPIGSQHHGPGSGRRDLLEGVVTGKAGVPANEKLDRVLGRIKNEKSGQAHTQARRSVSPTSQYSLDDTVEAYGRSRSVTPAGSVASVTTGPRVVGAVQRAVSPASTIGGRMSPTGSVGTRPGTVTPTGAGGRPDTRRNPSIASVMSDLSGYATPATHPMTPSPVEFESSRSTSGTPKLPHSSPLAQHQRQRSAGAPKPVNTRPPLPKDDFGVSHMMAIIEYKASKNKGMVDPPAKVDPVDDMLFGRQLDLASLHPKIRDIYADSFRQMDELDKFLDDQLARAQSKA